MRDNEDIEAPDWLESWRIWNKCFEQYWSNIAELVAKANRKAAKKAFNQLPKEQKEQITRDEYITRRFKEEY